MTLRVAVQMDPLESINIAGDSTFALMLAAQERGHELWHYDVRSPGAGRNGADHRLGRAGHGAAGGGRPLHARGEHRLHRPRRATSTSC